MSERQGSFYSDGESLVLRISWFFRLMTILAFAFGLYLVAMMLFIVVMNKLLSCNEFIYDPMKQCVTISQMLGLG